VVPNDPFSKRVIQLVLRLEMRAFCRRTRYAMKNGSSLVNAFSISRCCRYPLRVVLRSYNCDSADSRGDLDIPGREGPGAWLQVGVLSQYLWTKHLMLLLLLCVVCLFAGIQSGTLKTTASLFELTAGISHTDPWNKLCFLMSC
jgi:hypothetical protein